MELKITEIKQHIDSSRDTDNGLFPCYLIPTIHEMVVTMLELHNINKGCMFKREKRKKGIEKN